MTTLSLLHMKGEILMVESGGRGNTEKSFGAADGKACAYEIEILVCCKDYALILMV